MPIEAVVQSGALGLLVLVLFYGGKIAKSFLDNFLEIFKRLVDNLEKNTSKTEDVADVVSETKTAIQELRKENDQDHTAITDALRRLGGYRPSPAGGTPVVREKTHSRPER